MQLACGNQKTATWVRISAEKIRPRVVLDGGKVFFFVVLVHLEAPDMNAHSHPRAIASLLLAQAVELRGEVSDRLLRPCLHGFGEPGKDTIDDMVGQNGGHLCGERIHDLADDTPAHPFRLVIDVLLVGKSLPALADFSRHQELPDDEKNLAAIEERHDSQGDQRPRPDRQIGEDVKFEHIGISLRQGSAF